MKTAITARLEILEIKRDAKQVQFVAFEKPLNTAIQNGVTLFYVYESIDLIIDDLKELGYTATICYGAYNAIEYRVDFSEVTDNEKS